MIPIEEMVRSGYRSLASRTLDEFEKLKPSLERIPKANILLYPYESYLDILKKTGEIERLKSTDKDTSVVVNAYNIFNHMISYLEILIPDESKPHDFDRAKEMAIEAVSAYEGKERVDELLSEANISELRYDKDTLKPFIIESESNFDSSKCIFFAEQPNSTVYSLLGNIHSIVWELLPEKEIEQDIHEKFIKMKGYEAFAKEIHDNEKLPQYLIEIGFKSHPYRFFDRDDVRAVAEKAGMDMVEYDTFMKENIPRMDLLTCYIEGERDLVQTDIISESPYLKGTEELALYRLISLTHTLTKPLSKKIDMPGFVGIGLAEYMRNNPADADEMKNSSEFQKELTEKYFSDEYFYEPGDF